MVHSADGSTELLPVWNLGDGNGSKPTIPKNRQLSGPKHTNTIYIILYTVYNTILFMFKMRTGGTGFDLLPCGQS
jgi:hypothetical protein